MPDLGGWPHAAQARCCPPCPDIHVWCWRGSWTHRTWRIEGTGGTIGPRAPLGNAIARLEPSLWSFTIVCTVDQRRAARQTTANSRSFASLVCKYKKQRSKRKEAPQVCSRDVEALKEAESDSDRMQNQARQMWQAVREQPAEVCAPRRPPRDLHKGNLFGRSGALQCGCGEENPLII